MTNIGAKTDSEVLADVTQAMQATIQSGEFVRDIGPHPLIVVSFDSLVAWRNSLHVVLEHLRREEAR